MAGNLTPSENFLNMLYSTGDFNAAADAYKGAEMAKDLDVLYKTGKTASEASKASSMFQKLSNASKILGNAAKGAARTVVNPLTVGLLGGELVAQGLAIPNRIAEFKANQEMQNVINAQNIAKQLEAQGYDKLTAYQMANNLPVQGFDIPDNELKSLEARKAETDKIVKEEQDALNKAKESYNRALEKVSATTSNIALSSEDNTDKTSEITNVTPTTPSGANDEVLAQAIRELPQQTAGSVEPTLEQQLSSQVVNPQGQITPQDMMAQLNNYYNKVNQLIQNDPRYSGQMVQPTNQYNIDPNELARYQRWDLASRAMGADSGMANAYQQQAVQNYQQQLANQAGVPYEDYINAMTERRKLGILSQQEQIENALKVQAAQATDMKSKLGYLQEMEKLRQETARALQKAELEGQYELVKAGMQGQASRDVANINAVGDIARQQMYLSHPTTQLQAAGGFLGNTMGYGGGTFTMNALLALSPQQRVALFGQNLSDDAIKMMFQGVPGVPTAAQQPQINQGQGILPTISNWINPQR